MAISATLYRFQIELADIDAGHYATMDLRVAQHPSEGSERMVVRVLARALADCEGLEFGRGLSNVEDPALWKQSPTGEIELWIDVGIPSAERLHRAAKRADRVQVYTHKLTQPLRKEWASRSVHKAEDLEIIRIPAAFVSALAEDLARSMTWYLSVQDGDISLSVGERNLSASPTRTTLAAFLAEA